MSVHQADIVIYGAGIAGLWAHHHFSAQGYNCLLLENNAIGSGQTIASQGIIHSGLKYAFAGQINALAQSISAMPDRWRAVMRGEGQVNLQGAELAAASQYLMIPKGFMGGVIKLVSKRALGGSVHEIPKNDWPEDISKTGFQGSVIFMDEPVLNVPSAIRILAEPYLSSVKKTQGVVPDIEFDGDTARISINSQTIETKTVIFTGAGSNHTIADRLGHKRGLKTQARPLLMGFLKPAPFPLYAHLVGSSDKPVATITTHTRTDGELCWYLGGGVAERTKEANPQDVKRAMKKAFEKYLPDIDFGQFEWAVLPIDRVEGKSETQSWMPDTPTVHSHGNVHYCWPTKLTFAPMLADMLQEKMKKAEIKPSGAKTDWSFLEDAPFTETPWDTVQWRK